MHGAQQQAQSVQAIGHDQGHGVARLQTLAHEQRSNLAAILRKLGKSHGRGRMAWALRVGVTGIERQCI